MAKKLGIKWYDHNRIEITPFQSADLPAALLEKVRRMRIRRSLGCSWIVERFLTMASGYAMIF